VTANFDIAFEGEAWIDEDGHWRKVRLNLEGFLDADLADLSHWSEHAYQAQWLKELNEIIHSRDRGALITSIHDPSVGYRIWTWPMWKEGNEVHFQNRILFMLEPGPKFDSANLAEYVGDRQTLSEDGELISQWTVSLDAIRNFLDRQQNASGELCSPLS